MKVDQLPTAVMAFSASHWGCVIEETTLRGLPKGPLLFLWTIAVHGAGYEVRGVRGWAHLRDIEEGTRRKLPDQLPPLYQRGYLHREDVRDPSRAEPVWVYRITPSGALAVEQAHRVTHAEIPTLRALSSAPAVFLPARHRTALLILRAAHDDPATRAPSGEHGWLSAREMAARMEERPSAACVASQYSAAAFLHRKGLAERWIEPAPPGHQAARTFWRATERGRCLPLVEWKPLPESEN